MGNPCGASACVNAGTIQCDGSCTGTTPKSFGTDCGTCAYCDGNGNCNQWPADDSGCGTIDCSLYYVQTGTESPTSTEDCYNKADITNNRCEGVNNCKDANSVDCVLQANDVLQYSCGTCRYIDSSNCVGTTRGSCSNYPAGTPCGTGMVCDGNGNCVSSCIPECSSGQRKCNPSNSNQYAVCDTSVACYVWGTWQTCPDVDCDTLNYYQIGGTQGATTTSYCYYYDYADITTGKCEGSGTCKDSGDCSSPTQTTQATADECDYITGCSGSTSGTVSYYPAGTACTGGTCDGAGNCVPSSGDCTSPATFNSGLITEFTVQPTGTNGFTKAGACTRTNYCDSAPRAMCNSGTWSEYSNTCRNPAYVWVGGVVSGGTIDCSGPPCSGVSPGAPCSPPGGGCFAYCVSGAGATFYTCADRACGWNGVSFTCPSCSSSEITCPAKSYITGGSCGSVTLPSTSANSPLAMGCPGSCVGIVIATCGAGGAWASQSDTCHLPSGCSGGTHVGGNLETCTYGSTTHGQTISGLCSSYGSCSVSCFDGTVSVDNDCVVCVSDAHCDSCYVCQSGSCITVNSYCSSYCAYAGAGYYTCYATCMAAYPGC